MEMTITISKVDYNEIARDRITNYALGLGFSLADSGEQRTIKYFGTDSVSKISKLARRIKEEKRRQDMLAQFA